MPLNTRGRKDEFADSDMLDLQFEIHFRDGAGRMQPAAEKSSFHCIGAETDV
jgi:hypothetical protein